MFWENWIIINQIILFNIKVVVLGLNPFVKKSK